MFVIVDERKLVTNGYARRFDQEGVASAGFGGEQFIDWVTPPSRATCEPSKPF